MLYISVVDAATSDRLIVGGSPYASCWAVANELNQVSCADVTYNLTRRREFPTPQDALPLNSTLSGAVVQFLFCQGTGKCAFSEFGRFTFDWAWDGEEAVPLSRCTDELGEVQPPRTRELRLLGPQRDELGINLHGGALVKHCASRPLNSLQTGY
jgi:hypothetical protein